MQENRDLVPVEQVAGQLTTSQSASQQLADWGFAGIVPDYMTSLREDNKRDKALIFQMLNDKGERGKDQINKDLLAVDFLISPAEILDRASGEMKRQLLTRLINPDGTWIQTWSATVAKGLLLYHCKQRSAPWVPPLEYQLVSRKGANGDYLLFAPDGSTAFDEPGKPVPMHVGQTRRKP